MPGVAVKASTPSDALALLTMNLTRSYSETARLRGVVAAAGTLGGTAAAEGVLGVAAEGGVRLC